MSTEKTLLLIELSQSLLDLRTILFHSSPCLVTNPGLVKGLKEKDTKNENKKGGNNPLVFLYSKIVQLPVVRMAYG